MSTTFRWHEHDLAYARDDYNDTASCERAVEIPVACAFLSWHPGGRTLEVGNVLAHYECPWVDPMRTVVDLYETGPGVIAADITTWQGGPFQTIVSVSTVEHCHPENPQAPWTAVRRMLGMLAPGGQMLVTVPLGFRPELDDRIMHGRMRTTRDCTIVRADENGDWYQTVSRQWRPYASHGGWAAAVWIGEWDA